MKGYPGNPESGSLEHAYNYAHVRTRRVVENAFGRLKGRWQMSRSSQMNDPNFHTDCTLVCCALHNCRERHNDPFEDDWLPQPAAVQAAAAAGAEGPGAAGAPEAAAGAEGPGAAGAPEVAAEAEGPGDAGVQTETRAATVRKALAEYVQEAGGF